MVKELGRGTSHYFLFTGEPGERLRVSGVMDGDALLAAGLTVFASLSDHERRVMHTLMADQMEEPGDSIMALIESDIYTGGA